MLFHIPHHHMSHKIEKYDKISVIATYPNSNSYQNSNNYKTKTNKTKTSKTNISKNIPF